MWSPWINSDSGANDLGDKEYIDILYAQYPKRDTCVKPNLFQARSVLDQTPAELTGEVFIYYDIVKGFYCANSDQQDGLCLDYEVRMCCPGNQFLIS